MSELNGVEIRSEGKTEELLEFKRLEHFEIQLALHVSHALCDHMIHLEGKVHDTTCAQAFRKS